MKCDSCDNAATVHEVMIRGGKRVERHLCESCARQQGVPVGGNVPGAGAQISQLLSQFIGGAAAGTGAAPATPGAQPAAKAAKPIPACPTCQQTFAIFRSTGLMGCPDCYAAFEPQLTPLLARAHEGGTHHQGKKPASAGSAPASAAAAKEPTGLQKVGEDPALRIAGLRRQLEQAVAAEQYEFAAHLRDQLARLEGRTPPAPGWPPPQAPGPGPSTSGPPEAAS